MLGVDTNVLARFVLDDDPKQSRRANTVIKQARARAETLFVCTGVVLELVWVLGNAKFSRQEIVEIFDHLLDADGLAFESAKAVEQAFDDFAANSADFGECLFHALYERSECKSMLTFDRVAAKQLAHCTLL